MQLIPENISKQMDSLGRLSIPKHMRARLNIKDGTRFDIFTTQVDGRLFICFGEPSGDESLPVEIAEAIQLLESNGYVVSNYEN